MTRLKACIIGCGGIAKLHAEGFRRDGKVTRKEGRGTCRNRGDGAAYRSAETEERVVLPI